MSPPLRSSLASGVALAVLGLVGVLQPMAPARALEEVVVRIPLLDTSFTLRVSELQSPEALRNGSSDLAQLDRASAGAVGRQLASLLRQPVPLSLSQLADGSVGSPLLEQALLVLSSFGQVEGRPADLTGETLQRALRQASGGGEPTLLSLIEAIPGQRVTLDLGRAWAISTRMAQQRRVAEQLIASQPAVPAPTASPAPAVPVLRRQLRLPVPHRAAPLELLVLEPQANARGELVLISHGLWDGPSSFEGWGRLLAGRGYTVILPRHPGSDSGQQQAVLTGGAPPPGPDELALRPRDLTAVIDGLDQLALTHAVDPQRVVVLGHSWGATTALQLAGVRPTETVLRQRCGDLQDPERNLSWTLQCSWLRGVDQAAIQDRRVLAVAAVSPPVSLLFPRGSGQQLSGRVLLVSGSRDWVVPPDPEAIAPMRWGARRGNQLVLVQGGDHFNLRPGSRADGGALGPLMLAWTQAAFAAGAAARPADGSAPLLNRGPWGSAELPLVEATAALTPP
jgi:predicted dienelactone hydrolase